MLEPNGSDIPCDGGESDVEELACEWKSINAHGGAQLDAHDPQSVLRMSNVGLLSALYCPLLFLFSLLP